MMNPMRIAQRTATNTSTTPAMRLQSPDLDVARHITYEAATASSPAATIMLSRASNSVGNAERYGLLIDGVIDVRLL